MAGYPEIIENDFNGLLFKPDSVSSLVSQIKKLWTDEGLCIELGQNGFNKLKENYTQEIHFDQLIESYQDLIENKNQKF